ncbi:MAG TPA: hypothetical protein VMU14_02420 [Acidimicrobiales bacterium]|nr:hypothetical protein [Acidimicrobiales bacterium]
MIHVASAHIRTSRWLTEQLRYLHRHMSEPFDVYLSLEDVDPGTLGPGVLTFEHCGPHAGKLNMLAAEIEARADDGDLIMFLDGDAFPVEDPMPVIRGALEATDLVALQRPENAGDLQPHPAFCVTSVANWRRMHGDWSAGLTWKDDEGRWRSDVGGNLLRLLELHDMTWTPLRRTNTLDLHPVWFGVYAGVIYHHGAGFRAAQSRQDLQAAPRPLPTTVPGLRGLARSFNARRRMRWAETNAREVRSLSDEVFAELQQDFDFYRRFVSSSGASAPSTR